MCNDPSLRFLRQASFDFAQDRQASAKGFLSFVSGRISEEGMRVE